MNSVVSHFPHATCSSEHEGAALPSDRYESPDLDRLVAEGFFPMIATDPGPAHEWPGSRFLVVNGTPQVYLGPRTFLYNTPPELIVSANQAMKSNRTMEDYPDTIFPSTLAATSPQRFFTTLGAGDLGSAGFFLSSTGNVEFSQNGLPLRMAEAVLYQVGDKVIPFFGKLYVDDKPLPTEALKCLGISKMEQKVPVMLHGGRGITLPFAGDVRFIRNPDGGLILAEQEHAESAIVKKKAVALQFLGVGCKYCYHLEKEDAALSSHTVLLDAGVPAADLPGNSVLAQRLPYGGQSIIALDQAYQPFGTPTPIGGLARAGIVMNRQERLLRNNAILSGVTLDETVLFTKSELDKALGRDSGMVSSDLVVHCRAILDDTQRLTHLVDLQPGPLNMNHWRRLVDFIVSRYGEYSEQHLNSYFQRLGQTIGHNLMACARSGLSATATQNTLDNLSTFGGLIDLESLKEASFADSCTELGTSYLSNLMMMSEALGNKWQPPRMPALIKHFTDGALNYLGFNGDRSPFYSSASRSTLLSALSRLHSIP